MVIKPPFPNESFLVAVDEVLMFFGVLIDKAPYLQSV